MRIGVIGLGVVGKAVASAFQGFGDDVLCNDTNQKLWSSSFTWSGKDYMMQNSDVIFICVGTPNNLEGSIDLSAVTSVLKHLSVMKRTQNPVVAIKSSVIPGTTDTMRRIYPRLRLACNPEFLREKHAFQDFVNPSRIILGVTSMVDAKVLRDAYAHWPAPKILMDPLEAELVKYFSNAALVVKVAFANFLAEACRNYGTPPKIVVDALLRDKRFAGSHLDPTLGKISQKSPCLPKDTLAFYTALKTRGYDSDFLRDARALGVEGA